MTSRTEELRTLYPPIIAFKTGFLEVDDTHTLYYEQSGNPDGVPVVFLHGGPGGGSNPKHRQFFDPDHYHIIIFDQRGAGKSTPLGELKNNTTEHLIADMEQLREHLNIDKWHVFGGSWGSTLALCYSIAHPDRPLSITLRGIFMMQEEELQWFMRGMGNIFPEAWDAFTEHLSETEKENLIESYYKLLTDPNKDIHLPAAKRWSDYETACARLIPEQADPTKEITQEEQNFSYAIARIEAHYFLNNRFKPDNYILANVDKISAIPTVVVQGRYDIVCPPQTAYKLSKSLPKAEFIVIPDAGHSSSEPGVTDALIKAMDNFRKIKK